MTLGCIYAIIICARGGLKLVDRIIVEKSPSLKGEVRINGAKNSVLKLMAATLMADGECTITEVPNLKDVQVMIEVLKELGSRVEYDDKNGILITEVVDSTKTDLPYRLTSKMRASIVVMGPLLSKRGRANVSLPGGCPIGARPIDLHIKGFKALGAEVKTDHGDVEALSNGELNGAHIYLDFPSVGATENILMASIFAKGTTILENAAQEPEITDLANFLNKMGAKISGAGTSTIRIKGVESLEGKTHQVVSDRIEAGTYMVAAAITKGRVKIDNVMPKHLMPIISKLEEMGVKVEEYDDYLIVDASNGFVNANVTTLPYPGFPTDMQSQFMALLSVASGISVIKETIYENRFMHVNELTRMGANISIDGSSAIIQGVEKMGGASVKATDLRAGAALILAGLVAEGQTEVYNPYHIDRGYVNIVENLRNLGAIISRASD